MKLYSELRLSHFYCKLLDPSECKILDNLHYSLCAIETWLVLMKFYSVFIAKVILTKNITFFTANNLLHVNAKYWAIFVQVNLACVEEALF